MTQHEKVLRACGMPMSAPDAQGASDKYCAYCSDSDGNLKSGKRPYPVWRLSRRPQKVGVAESRKQAKRYLTAMPAGRTKRTSNLPGRLEEIIPGTDRHADNIAIAFSYAIRTGINARLGMTT